MARYEHWSLKYFLYKGENKNDALNRHIEDEKKGMLVEKAAVNGKLERERERERKKNISATLTATEKQSRQFRSPCNCSCSVYFLLRAPPKKTLYPPLEGNCYLRTVNLVVITRRLISRRFFHHYWYLKLCYLLLCVFMEPLWTYRYKYVRIFFYIWYAYIVRLCCTYYS